MTFFRKHMKLIMAVGGSILMVIFLIPQAATSLQGSPTDRPLGTIGQRELTIGDKRRAAGELSVVQRALSMTERRLREQAANLGEDQQSEQQALQQMFQGVQRMRAGLPSNRRGGGESDPAMEWLLLTEEARLHGLYASRAELDSILRTLGISPEQIVAQLLADGDRGVGRNGVYQAMRHWQMIVKLKRMLNVDPRPTEPQMRRFAKQFELMSLANMGLTTGDRLKLRLVGIPASHATDQAGEPSKENLQRLFDDYADVPPGAGEPFGLGYRLPNRVKLEYIEVNRNTIHDDLLTRTSTRDQAMSWLNKPANAAQVREAIVAARQAEAENAEDDADDAPTNPLAQIDPAKWDDMPLAERFAAVEDMLMSQTTTRLAAQKQREILNTIMQQLNAPLEDLPRNDRGYIDPDRGAIPMVDLEKVALEVNVAHGVLPNFVRMEDRWLSMQDIAELSFFGDAVVYVQRGRGGEPEGVEVAQYIASARAFAPAPDNQLARRFKLQARVPSVPVETDRGRAYVFRLIDTDPARKPYSLDEVREQVVEDARRLEAYQALEQTARRDYLPIARTAGLERFIESLGETFEVKEPAPFARKMMLQYPGQLPMEREPFITAVESPGAFADAAFAMAQPLIDAGEMDDLSPEQRFAVLPIDQELTVYLVELVEYLPLTAEDYAAARPVITDIMATRTLMHLGDRAENPFALDAIKRRVGFVEADEEEAPGPASNDESQTSEDDRAPAPGEASGN